MKSSTAMAQPYKRLTPQQRSSKRINYFKRTWMLYLMLVLPMLFFFVFRYIPMGNIIIAFEDYSMFKGIFASPFVGFKWFAQAFQSNDFYNALRNTFVLNILDLIIGFPAPIILAILLNELAFKRYKKVSQTIAYMPHFLSWIIVSALATELLGPSTGVVNTLLISLGMQPIDFLMDKTLWVVTYLFLGVWKEIGWNTIIYLAAITGINAELYEAAEVDGAKRLRKIWHVTLPGLRPTIVVLLIMAMGRILGSEFDRPYALMNPMVLPVADLISTLVYRVGIKSFQFSYTAAIGLFQSVVSVIFLIGSNKIAKRVGDRGIW
ncbi:ABC transporter permease [Acetanaerobacterium elongatum]|uniref:Carbohydrate ABC transporter membrane protein 1, CUT1 family n=1 Tax=Acetanaerobacterium elongatum TaxID=258515 RepID=A0A1H0C7I1_9FIRM|nr:ABC transporter permease subunit [Acetanaerobacterium elongatum]SDN53819.1 carbohydrate ABC transporter membrane protein 1, CUT1 family [Acetanaerobacterium elongatum]